MSTLDVAENYTLAVECSPWNMDFSFATHAVHNVLLLRYGEVALARGLLTKWAQSPIWNDVAGSGTALKKLTLTRLQVLSWQPVTCYAAMAGIPHSQWL